MYGLVLEGGGAKGSYHIGVYKALLELGVDIGGVVGSSIGALNGAMIVQGEYEKCNELWSNITYSMVVDVEDEDIDRLINSKISKEDLVYFKEKIKNLIINRGFDITPLKQLLDKYIDEDKIRASGLDFGVATINLTTRKLLNVFLEDIPRGELVNYLMASAYLPVFKPEKIGGHRYLDGGFYDNLPFKMLIEKGYKDLILVRTHAMGLTRKLDLGDTNSVVISPSGDIGRSFEYDSNRAKTNILMGYYDGLRPFKGLKGNKYYILPKGNDDFYLDFLLNLDEKKIEEIADLLKIPQGHQRRILFELIIPKICSLLSMDKECSYEDIIICILEKKAEKLGIEKYQIYEIEELISLVENRPTIWEEEPRILDKIIEKVDIFPIFYRDEILLEIADIIFNGGD